MTEPVAPTLAVHLRASTNLAIYKVEPPRLDESLLRGIAKEFGLNLSTNDLEHRPDGRLKWSSGGSEIGYFDRESIERKRTVTRRDVSFFQRVPGGGTTTGVGDGGHLRMSFVSDGKVADIECLFRKVVKVGDARSKTGKQTTAITIDVSGRSNYGFVTSLRCFVLIDPG